MKLNELLVDFEIYRSNEEQKMLESLEGPTPITQFDERQRVIIDNLIRKSLVSKVKHSTGIIIVKNEY
jgi:hypothetical protein